MTGVSNVVNVTDTITPQGILRRVFGIGLLVTTDTQLGTGANRIVVLPDSDTGSDNFTAGTEPRKCSDIWFQQVPYPKNLVVGRWINADVGADLTGNGLTTLAVFQAISDGSFEMNGEDYTAMNFSAALSFADCAAVIEAKFAAGTDVNLKTATVAYDAVAGELTVTTATTGATATLTYATTVSPASGTDIAALTGWDTAAAGTLNQGADEETIDEAIEAIIALNDSPYFILLDETIAGGDDILAVSTWVASRRYMFASFDTGPDALVPSETGSMSAQLFALEPPRTFGMWSNTLDYKEASSCARLSSFNPAQRKSIITLNLKELPGTTPDDITQTQLNELQRKNVNVYTPMTSTGSDPDNAYLTGTTFKSGVWTDVRFWLDWFVNATQLDVYNLLKASGRVPQTEAGVTAEQRAIEAVCQTGVLNGGSAPGQLSTANILDVQQTTGNLDFDGYLPKGYLIYASPIATQAQADRALRKSPPFKIWLKGSGAIHFVEIAITFEN